MSGLRVRLTAVLLPSGALAVTVLLLAAGWVLPTMASGGGAGQSDPLKVGRLIGRFSVADLEGRTWSNRDLQGRFTVLFLWSLGCPYCMAEMPAVDEFAKTRDDGDRVVLVTMNIDDPALAPRVSKLLRENRAKFPVLLVGDWLKRVAVPRTVLVGPSGRVIDGFSGRVGGMRSGFSWCSRVNRMLARAGEHEAVCKKEK